MAAHARNDLARLLVRVMVPIALFVAFGLLVVIDMYFPVVSQIVDKLEGLTIALVVVALAVIILVRLWGAVLRTRQLVIEPFGNASGVSDLNAMLPGFSILAREHFVTQSESVYDQVFTSMRRADGRTGTVGADEQSSPVEVDLPELNWMQEEILRTFPDPKRTPLPQPSADTRSTDLYDALKQIAPKDTSPILQVLSTLFPPRGTRVLCNLQRRGDSRDELGISIEIGDLSDRSVATVFTLWESSPPRPRPGQEPRPGQHPGEQDRASAVGEVYYKMGLLDQAESYYLKALEEQPDSEGAANGLQRVLDEKRTVAGRYYRLLGPAMRWLAIEIARRSLERLDERRFILEDQKFETPDLNRVNSRLLYAETYDLVDPTRVDDNKLESTLSGLDNLDIDQFDIDQFDIDRLDIEVSDQRPFEQLNQVSSAGRTQSQQIKVQKKDALLANFFGTLYLASAVAYHLQDKRDGRTSSGFFFSLAMKWFKHAIDRAPWWYQPYENLASTYVYRVQMQLLEPEDLADDTKNISESDRRLLLQAKELYDLAERKRRSVLATLLRLVKASIATLSADHSAREAGEQKRKIMRKLIDLCMQIFKDDVPFRIALGKAKAGLFLRDPKVVSEETSIFPEPRNSFLIDDERFMYNLASWYSMASKSGIDFGTADMSESEMRDKAKKYLVYSFGKSSSANVAFSSEIWAASNPYLREINDELTGVKRKIREERASSSGSTNSDSLGLDSHGKEYSEHMDELFKQKDTP